MLFDRRAEVDALLEGDDTRVGGLAAHADRRGAE